MPKVCRFREKKHVISKMGYFWWVFYGLAFLLEFILHMFTASRPNSSHVFDKWFIINVWKNVCWIMVFVNFKMLLSVARKQPRLWRLVDERCALDASVTHLPIGKLVIKCLLFFKLRYCDIPLTCFRNVMLFSVLSRSVSYQFHSWFCCVLSMLSTKTDGKVKLDPPPLTKVSVRSYLLFGCK